MEAQRLPRNKPLRGRGGIRTCLPEASDNALRQSSYETVKNVPHVSQTPAFPLGTSRSPETLHRQRGYSETFPGTSVHAAQSLTLIQEFSWIWASPES